MTTKEILTAARGRIANKENWIRGNLWNENGDCCALGAIYKTSGQSNPHHEAVKALASVIDVSSLPEDPYNEPFDRCVQFGIGEAATIARHNNTQPHDCVIAAFDAAIEGAE